MSGFKTWLALYSAFPWKTPGNFRKNRLPAPKSSPHAANCNLPRASIRDSASASKADGLIPSLVAIRRSVYRFTT